MAFIDKQLEDKARKIERGDIVNVVFTRNDIFDQQTSCKVKCKLTRIPAGPGDTFGLLRMDNEQPIKINGNSSDFVGMEFIERPSEF